MIEMYIDEDVTGCASVLCGQGLCSLHRAVRSFAGVHTLARPVYTAEGENLAGIAPED